MKIRLLSQKNIKDVLSMKDAITATATAFSELANGQANIPLRTPIEVPSESGLSLFMPGFLPEQEQLGLKVVSIFPKNINEEKPAISGVILLLDSKTGEPKALLEAGYLTALRTGAVSGLATDLLAAPDARSVAIIGSGVQANTQLEAVMAVRNIEEVNVYSRTEINAEKFVNVIKEKYSYISIKVCKTIDKACNHAEIICTATNSKEPLIYLDDINHAAHINAIGSHNKTMQEIDASVLEKAKIVVDQISAALTESGEIIKAVKAGMVNQNMLIELGHMVNNPKKYLGLRQELTCFKSVGLAIQDIAVAEKALALAEINSIGQMVEL